MRPFCSEHSGTNSGGLLIKRDQFVAIWMFFKNHFVLSVYHLPLEMLTTCNNHVADYFRGSFPPRKGGPVGFYMHRCCGRFVKTQGRAETMFFVLRHALCRNVFSIHFTFSYFSHKTTSALGSNFGTAVRKYKALEQATRATKCRDQGQV